MTVEGQGPTGQEAAASLLAGRFLVMVLVICPLHLLEQGKKRRELEGGVWRKGEVQAEQLSGSWHIHSGMR